MYDLRKIVNIANGKKKPMLFDEGTYVDGRGYGRR